MMSALAKRIARELVKNRAVALSSPVPAKITPSPFPASPMIVSHDASAADWTSLPLTRLTCPQDQEAVLGQDARAGYLLAFGQPCVQATGCEALVVWELVVYRFRWKCPLELVCRREFIHGAGRRSD